MKKRHDGEQPVAFCETEPAFDLPCVSDQVAVRQQTALGLTRCPRCVDDDRFRIPLDRGRRQWAERMRELQCGPRLVVKLYDVLQAGQLIANSINARRKLRMNKERLGFG